MAIMIPGCATNDDFNYSGGELLLFDRLQNLSDDYYVFHSTHWNEKRRRNEMSARTYVQWGEADFTIFHPSYGIIVFEVKDGLISYTRERGWIQKNRKTGEVKTIDPMQQAERSKYFFLDRLKDAFAGYCPYSLCSAVWFTAGDRKYIEGSLPLSYKEETVLWANDLESPIKIEQAIKKIYRFYDTTQVQPTDSVTKTVLDTLAPEYGAFQSLRVQVMATKAMFFRMTREQAFLLDYLEEQETAAIHGTAGTGKTVLAVQKAQRLASEDKVLFLCFNRFLKEHLAAAYPDDNIDYYNLEALYSKKNGKMLPSMPIQRDAELFDFLVDWESYSWPYKHIVIDEGQDFKDEHLQALYEIAQAKRGAFYVFYDRNQFVQGLKFPEWLDLMECRLVLSRNCRNTKEIAITSTRSIGLQKDRIKMRRDTDDGVHLPSPKPTLFIVKEKEELKQILLKLLQKYCNAGIAKQNIVVLSCKNDGESILQEADYILAPAYRLSKNKSENTVLFTTVRKFKGLEADVVICIDVDGETFSTEKTKNAFYVGTSRATTCLDIVTNEKAERLAEVLTGSQSKGPRAFSAISNFLCVKIGSAADYNS